MTTFYKFYIPMTNYIIRIQRGNKVHVRTVPMPLQTPVRLSNNEELIGVIRHINPDNNQFFLCDEYGTAKHTVTRSYVYGTT